MGSPPQIECHFLFPSFEDFEMRLCSSSNSRNQQDRHRHYWVVEFENGIPKFVFDSLQGKQRLTTELAKKLRVFGVLFNVGDEHVPFLRTKYLDEAAGIVPAISRGRNPIVVLGRGRIQWARNALCKKYKAPTSKKGRVQKHTLKGFKQNRQSGKPGGARSSNGPPALNAARPTWAACVRPRSMRGGLCDGV